MDQLLGRVVVVAGDDALLANAATAALAAGAKVAVISRALGDATAATVRFNADPRDPGAWERISMHVEQHLGPVDGVVTDEQSRPVVVDVFGADLARRGRAGVLVMQPGDDPRTLVTHLAGTPPATPSRPRPVVPDQ